MTSGTDKLTEQKDWVKFCRHRNVLLGLLIKKSLGLPEEAVGDSWQDTFLLVCLLTISFCLCGFSASWVWKALREPLPGNEETLLLLNEASIRPWFPISSQCWVFGNSIRMNFLCVLSESDCISSVAKFSDQL